MSNCKQVDIPDLNLIKDECNGIKYSTDCIIVPFAIPELALGEGKTLSEVLKKIVEAYNTVRLKNDQYQKAIETINSALS